MPDLKNKVSLITGAGSGIGAATAVYFAKCGSSVSINDQNTETLRKTAQDCIEAGLNQDQVLCVPGDITLDLVPEDIVKKTMDHFGKLDVLVNCAGIYRSTPVTDESVIDKFDAIISVNLRAMYRLIHVAIPHLKNTQGNVVNVSSVVSNRAGFGQSAYAISKGGVDQVTRSMALELGAFNVRVNSVNPGVVVTNISSHEMGEVSEEKAKQGMEAWGRMHALGRVSLPEEIAKPIAFLASNEASFITGTNLLIDGGLSLHLGPK